MIACAEPSRPVRGAFLSCTVNHRSRMRAVFSLRSLPQQGEECRCCKMGVSPPYICFGCVFCSLVAEFISFLVGDGAWSCSGFCAQRFRKMSRTAHHRSPDDDLDLMGVRGRVEFSEPSRESKQDGKVPETRAVRGRTTEFRGSIGLRSTHFATLI